MYKTDFYESTLIQINKWREGRRVSLPGSKAPNTSCSHPALKDMTQPPTPEGGLHSDSVWRGAVSNKHLRQVAKLSSNSVNP